MKKIAITIVLTVIISGSSLLAVPPIPFVGKILGVATPPGMVFVRSGPFMMGCNEAVDNLCSDVEKPYHKVYLDAFFIDKFEVTVAQYTACVNEGKCTAAQTGGSCNYGNADKFNHPVNCVNWDQAKSYCEYAGKRLPTEAEWEKAARGTDGRIFPWGNREVDCTNAAITGEGEECGKNSTWHLRKKPAGASPYGAMDMAGNVWEWTDDRFDENYYESSPARNPKGPDSGRYRVLRGGSWYLNPNNLRATYRLWYVPSHGDFNFGIRCAKTP